ncbi:MAG TPA: glycosyltransferase family 4 protein [Firmicutes bacterium]|nr:glycosyltransferase family 4 protein [Bacillota bacterium]
MRRDEREGKRVRVLFQSRPDILTLPAGDTIQLFETMQHLRRLGVHIDHSGELHPPLDGYDLVHLFNITRIAETRVQCDNAVAQGKPVVISTIYWNMEEYFEREETRHAADLLKWWKRDNAYRAETLKKASLLLPNAVSEMELIKKDFGVDRPYRVVPNGADPGFGDAKASEFVAEYGVDKIILCVGRISPRKNQLAVVKALRCVDIPLFFIGSVNDPFYLELCRKHAGPHVRFVTHMPHSRLASAYKAAKVHVLASWYDTPGLASLEAAVAGCNIVSTNRGTAREYFGDLAWYCDPADPDSIRRAVLDAYESAPRSALVDVVKREFTWERAAQVTLEAYRTVMMSTSMMMSG